MKKKGISPVIATVLLIAITVAMALIIFLWFRSMTTENITKFGGEHIKLSCDKVEIQAEYSDGKIYISNLGNIPVYSVVIDAFYDGRHEAKRIDEINAIPKFIVGSLRQGGTYSGDISDHVDNSEVEKIKVIPILLGNSDEGKKTYICEDSKSIKEIFVK